MSKVVVFDLDETLGHFVELGMFWDALQNYHKKKMNKVEFFETMEMFPEFIRPYMTNILKYLIKKKKKGECDDVMIFTNNQGPKSWTKMIADYFNWKIKYPLFVNIIGAYKVDNNQIEMCRTSHSKKYSDLLKCTNLPPNTQVCFLDDQYHPHMEHSNVEYINSRPYVYELTFNEMALRYYKRKGMKGVKNVFVGNIVEHMNQYNFNPHIKLRQEQIIDKIISKKILEYLKIFFKNSRPPYTRRRIKIKRRRTYKH